MPAHSATGPPAEPGSKAARGRAVLGELIGRLSLSRPDARTAAPRQARAALGRAHSQKTQHEARRLGRRATESRLPY